jgi:methylated-DNA-[protein]-cysteine S-methyltransferase
VRVRGGRLIWVDLPASSAPARRGRDSAGRRPVATCPGAVSEADDVAIAARWAGELDAYFEGELLSWTAEQVGLTHLEVGESARAVYAALLTVPPGATVSYGALAAMAGYPRAARAVGTCMANNPIPIVVPCHRVIRADGSLGNYGSDPHLKGLLLAHEWAHGGRL